MGVWTGLMLLSLLVIADASPAERIVGGSVATIGQYPFAVVFHIFVNNNWQQYCAGSIINNRSIISSAQCFMGRSTQNFRARSGATFASSGGVVHNVNTIIIHPNYNQVTLDNDISIIRLGSEFYPVYRPGRIAGANYNLGDNQPVWAIGWGFITPNGPVSEELRHVQLVIVNQTVCRRSYFQLTDNMLCAGWPTGGRASCSMDSGGPLVHYNIIVGVTSFGAGCGVPNYPGVYTRISRYTSWIQSNS